ncbi:hypothetical protein LCGC14_1475430 [marine sediment metagenome]|uniref:Uncharacterized protein n=1 Tax=marine sediment metagenome TaxID=412755 RepID=A0A0F9MCV2_9ZZZZ
MAQQICSKCYTCIDDRFDIVSTKGVLPVVCFDCMIEDVFPTESHILDPTEIGNNDFQEAGT